MITQFKNSQEFIEHCFKLSKNSNGKIKVSQLKNTYASANGYPTVAQYMAYLDSKKNTKLILKHDFDSSIISAQIGNKRECFSSRDFEKFEALVSEYAEWDINWFYEKLKDCALKVIKSFKELDEYHLENFRSGIMDHLDTFTAIKNFHFSDDFINDSRIQAARNLFSYRFALAFKGMYLDEDYVLEDICKLLETATHFFIEDFVHYMVEELVLKLTEQELRLDYKELKKRLNEVAQENKIDFIFEKLS